MNTRRDSRDEQKTSFSLRSRIARPALVLSAILLLLASATAGCSMVYDVQTTTTTPSEATDLAQVTTTTEPATTTTTQRATTTTRQATTTTTTEAVDDSTTTTTTTTTLMEGTTTTTAPGDLAVSTTTTTLQSAWSPFGPQNPASAVLYEIEDWSANVGGWAAAGPWKTADGMLVNDGSGNSYTVAPVDLTGHPDYVVECEAQIVDPSAGTAVLLLARLINGTAYYGGFDCESSRMVVGYNTSELGSAGFVLDSEWHTYRLEVRGSSIKLYLEQAEVARAVDDRIQEAGTVGIYCGKGQVNIRSFTVTAL